MGLVPKKRRGFEEIVGILGYPEKELGEAPPEIRRDAETLKADFGKKYLVYGDLLDILLVRTRSEEYWAIVYMLYKDWQTTRNILKNLVKNLRKAFKNVPESLRLKIYFEINGLIRELEFCITMPYEKFSEYVTYKLTDFLVSAFLNSTISLLIVLLVTHVVSQQVSNYVIMMILLFILLMLPFVFIKLWEFRKLRKEW